MGLPRTGDDPEELDAIVSTAYECSVAAITIRDPAEIEIAGVRDVIMLAVLELARAGQTDLTKLVTYAVWRARAFASMQRVTNVRPEED